MHQVLFISKCFAFLNSHAQVIISSPQNKRHLWKWQMVNAICILQKIFRHFTRLMVRVVEMWPAVWGEHLTFHLVVVGGRGDNLFICNLAKCHKRCSMCIFRISQQSNCNLNSACLRDNIFKLLCHSMLPSYVPLMTCRLPGGALVGVHDIIFDDQ